jgi:hypothetical protein
LDPETGSTITVSSAKIVSLFHCLDRTVATLIEFISKPILGFKRLQAHSLVDGPYVNLAVLCWRLLAFLLSD